MSSATIGRGWGPFVDGVVVPASSGRTFDTVDPSTGDVVEGVHEADHLDVDRAVVSAASAFPAWRALKPLERGRLLLRLSEALLANLDRFAELESLDAGKPLWLARGDVVGTARYFEYYGSMADKLQGETIPLGDGYLSYTRHEPFGVVGVITPWNGPVQQIARSLAPALMMGNTVVAKPAEQTPLSCIELARLAIECGIHPGVFNVVPGFGDVAGAALVENPGVRKVVFTGSVATGRLVAVAAAKRLIPVTLELGGKSADIIFADADLDAAVRGAWLAINVNAGQICSAGSRLLVQAEVHDRVVDGLTRLNAEMTMGSGSDDRFMGPVVTSAHQTRVEAYIEVARTEGVTVIRGGPENLPEAGCFVRPTLFVGVTNDMRVAQEEIFGPVLSVIPFEDEAEAVAIANDSEYGLAAGIWTSNLGRAHRVAAQIEAGQVYVNEYWAGGVETPFGGVKNSGYGREKGVAGALTYSYLKSVTIKL